MEFKDLPTELKFKIFSYLTEVQLKYLIPDICPEWKEIVEQPIFCKSLHFRGRRRSVKQLTKTLTKYHLIQTLEFSNISFWNLADQLAMPELCNLGTINFYKCKVIPELFSNMAPISPLVDSIAFYDCTNVNSNVINEIVQWKCLKSIRMNACENVDFEKTFEMVSENCEYLEKIRVHVEFGTISNSSILNFLQKRGKTLKSFEIFNAQLMTSGYLEISKCLSLTELSISVENLTDFELIAFKELVLLRKLLLRKSKQVTAEGFQQFFLQARFPLLEELYLLDCTNFTDKGAKVIGTSCPAIQIIYLGLCPKITDEGIQSIVSSCGNIKEMSINNLEEVKGTWMKDITTHLPHLNSLTIGLCPQITYETVAQSKAQNPNVYISDQ